MFGWFRCIGQFIHTSSFSSARNECSLHLVWHVFAIYPRKGLSWPITSTTTLITTAAVHRRSLLGLSLWCYYRQVHSLLSNVWCYPDGSSITNPGPYGAGVFDPRSWANGNEETSNTITLEFTRVVLAIGVFAIGVELPKAYVARHWKSLFFLLGPVMTWVRRVYLAFI